MRQRLGLVGCVAVLASLISGISGGQETAKKPPPPPPLNRMQVESLLAAGVTTLDILNEAVIRGLDFDLSSDVVAAWEKQGIDPVLLNNLSFYSLATNQKVVAASKLMADKKYDEASTQLGEVLQPSKSPRCVLALRLRGICLRKLKQYDRAVEDFVRVLQYDPNDLEVNSSLGATLAEAGKFAEAEKLLTQVIADFPWRASYVRGILANVHEQSGQFSEATADLLTALQYNPADPELLTRLALLRSSMPGSASLGDSAAREFALAAVLLNPEDSQPQGGEPKVLEEQVSRWKQRRVWTLQASALLFALEGKFSEAKDEQQKAITLAKELGTDMVDEDRLARITTIQEAYAADKRFQFKSARPGLSAIASLDSKGAAELLVSRLVPITGGKFQMGSTRGAADEKPVREITVRDFRLSSHEVTNIEWAAVMSVPLAGPADEAHELVSWDDCQEFISRLNKQVPNELAEFRLPTEAEWEFAAKAGTTTDFSFGDDPLMLREHGWHDKNWKGKASPVGQLPKNAFGLFDMHGNVAEWCQDVYAPYGVTASGASDADTDQSLHVVRGGHRRQTAQLCRSAARGFATAKDRLRGIGFRLAANSNGESVAKNAKQVPGPSPLGLVSIIDRANDTSLNSISPDGRRNLESMVQLILGYVMLELQNEKAALAAFEKVQNISSPPVFGGDDRLMLTPNLWLIAKCSSGWIWATSGNPDIRDPQKADACAKEGNLQTRNTNWLPYVIRAAANAALKNWNDARKWEDNALEQSKHALAHVSVRVENASRKRKEQYGKNELPTIQPLPFPLDEFFFRQQ